MQSSIGSQESRKKFHENISDMLDSVPSWIASSDFPPSRQIVVVTLLTLLGMSDMKPAHAHSIAKQHNNLPELLHSVGNTNLVSIAVETLENLKNRQDESSGQIRAQLAADIADSRQN